MVKTNKKVTVSAPVNSAPAIAPQVIAPAPAPQVSAPVSAPQVSAPAPAIGEYDVTSKRITPNTPLKEWRLVPSQRKSFTGYYIQAGEYRKHPVNGRDLFFVIHEIPYTDRYQALTRLAELQRSIAPAPAPVSAPAPAPQVIAPALPVSAPAPAPKRSKRSDTIDSSEEVAESGLAPKRKRKVA